MAKGRGLDGDADSRRVWLGSLLPIHPGGVFKDNGNWKSLPGGKPVSVPLTADEWGRNASISLEKIFLRYRLDGLDINIEDARDNFGEYICSMLRHTEKRMGPGTIFTVTPFSFSWRIGKPANNGGKARMYHAVAEQCLDLISWANWQTYDDYDRHTLILNAPVPKITDCANVFGWNKTTWGISTQGGSARPTADAAVSLQQQLRGLAPTVGGDPQDIRGVFVWTVENSAKCDPPFCYEDMIWPALNGVPPPPPWAHKPCTC
jgi:hypothetical protein